MRVTHDKMTQDDFDRILDQVVGKLSAAQVLAIDGVRELVQEELNNEVLEAWEKDLKQLSHAFRRSLTHSPIHQENALPDHARQNITCSNTRRLNHNSANTGKSPFPYFTRSIHLERVFRCLGLNLLFYVSRAAHRRTQ